MQISIEQIRLGSDSSFRVYEYPFLAQDQPFHSHEEFELAVVVGTGGILYCGAATSEFASGDLFLFGSRLPHRFVSRSSPGEEGTGDVRAHVVQFRRNSFGDGFFRLPENAPLRALLAESAVGLAFRNVGPRGLMRVAASSGPRRLAALVTLLADTADAHERSETERLSPGTPFLSERGTDAERLSRLQDYIESEYAGNASLDGAADRLALTRTSFCRYVKRTTGRTFSDLLNDYRLTVAAIRLRDPSSAVSEVSAEVGYGSLSHFNARFRERFDMTPSEFRKRTADGGA